MSREQVDLGYIWEQVNELSAILEENRQYTNQITEKAAVLTSLFNASDFKFSRLTLPQRRALNLPTEDPDSDSDEEPEFHDAHAGDDPSSDEEPFEEATSGPPDTTSPPVQSPPDGSAPSDPTTTTSPPTDAPSQPTKPTKSVKIHDPKSKTPRADLEAQLTTLTSELTDAKLQLTKQESAYQTQTHLVKTYETALTQIIDQIRTYSLQQSKSIINIHKSYNTQLQNERMVSEELRNENARILDAVRELSKGVREAYREGAWESGEVNGLRAENRMLREALGLRTGEEGEKEGVGA
ncbi:hypothetical protein BJ508DRAFT_177424 [Ascobolus immersus RN42]|uniref:Uncharacterized protein n=1 Tax=Ascobolus immersus RN42 TaxID=1160509 RepID=A0A3N4IIP6_ASCIM|nr:hypothetical protein BJ508DRAFT_177424 [Ascobolus immersus RN42]